MKKKAHDLGSKIAALVGTDISQLYVISPEMLYKIVKGSTPKHMSWEGYADQVWGEPDFRIKQPLANTFTDMGDIVVKHGGAVFDTGGDGFWEVEVLGTEDTGRGYEYPYGTPDFDTVIQKVARRYEEKE